MTQTIQRGTDKDLTLTFTDDNGDAIDISGYTVFFTVKPSIDNDPTDANAVISKTITSHENAEMGKTVVSLTKEDTLIEPKNYYYDVKVKNASGKLEIPDEFPLIFTINGNVTGRTN